MAFVSHSGWSRGRFTEASTVEPSVLMVGKNYAGKFVVSQLKMPSPKISDAIVEIQIPGQAVVANPIVPFVIGSQALKSEMAEANLYAVGRNIRRRQGGFWRHAEWLKARLSPIGPIVFAKSEEFVQGNNSVVELMRFVLSSGPMRGPVRESHFAVAKQFAQAAAGLPIELLKFVSSADRAHSTVSFDSLFMPSILMVGKNYAGKFIASQLKMPRIAPQSESLLFEMPPIAAAANPMPVELLTFVLTQSRMASRQNESGMFEMPPLAAAGAPLPAELMRFMSVPVVMKNFLFGASVVKLNIYERRRQGGLWKHPEWMKRHLSSVGTAMWLPKIAEVAAGSMPVELMEFMRGADRAKTAFAQHSDYIAVNRKADQSPLIFPWLFGQQAMRVAMRESRLMPRKLDEPVVTPLTVDLIRFVSGAAAFKEALFEASAWYAASKERRRQGAFWKHAERIKRHASMIGPTVWSPKVAEAAAGGMPIELLHWMLGSDKVKCPAPSHSDFIAANRRLDQSPLIFPWLFGAAAVHGAVPESRYTVRKIDEPLITPLTIDLQHWVMGQNRMQTAVPESMIVAVRRLDQTFMPFLPGSERMEMAVPLSQWLPMTPHITLLALAFLATPDAEKRTLQAQSAYAAVNRLRDVPRIPFVTGDQLVRNFIFNANTWLQWQHVLNDVRQFQSLLIFSALLAQPSILDQLAQPQIMDDILDQGSIEGDTLS